MPLLAPGDIAELEEEYFADDSPYGLFRTCRFTLSVTSHLIPVHQVPPCACRHYHLSST